MPGLLAKLDSKMLMKLFNKTCYDNPRHHPTSSKPCWANITWGLSGKDRAARLIGSAYFIGFVILFIYVEQFFFPFALIILKENISFWISKGANADTCASCREDTNCRALKMFVFAGLKWRFAMSVMAATAPRTTPTGKWIHIFLKNYNSEVTVLHDTDRPKASNHFYNCWLEDKNLRKHIGKSVPR